MVCVACVPIVSDFGLRGAGIVHPNMAKDRKHPVVPRFVFWCWLYGEVSLDDRHGPSLLPDGQMPLIVAALGS